MFFYTYQQQVEVLKRLAESYALTICEALEFAATGERDSV